MASLIRKRRRQQQRIDVLHAERAKVDAEIEKLDKAIDAMGPWNDSDLKLALRLAKAQLQNKLTDMAVAEAMRMQECGDG